MLTELETLVKELKHFVKYYHNEYEEALNSTHPIQNNMKDYYLGKYDAFSHSLALVAILYQRELLNQDDMLQDMANRFDNENEVVK